jgi:hypothetical protein
VEQLKPRCAAAASAYSDPLRGASDDQTTYFFSVLGWGVPEDGDVLRSPGGSGNDDEGADEAVADGGAEGGAAGTKGGGAADGAV